MKLWINGEPREFEEIETIAGLLRKLEIDPEAGGIAVAQNRDVILRAEYPRRPLSEGDRIEIVQAVQGG